MPRIPISLLRQAHTLDPFLPALLASCRSLYAAQSELRWLREHVERVAKARRARGDMLAKGALLRHLVKERVSGKPLQYILGTEYFGDLEIRCRPGVLIPRWVSWIAAWRVNAYIVNRQDTAASVIHLVQLLHNAQKLPPELRLLDLCTGTGCIPLLFRHELSTVRPDVHLRILGVDVSDKALGLARHNIRRIGKSRSNAGEGRLELLKADVLLNPFADQVEGPLSLKAAFNFYNHPSFWDILVSNPPYISPTDYWKTTTRAVRGYEPKLALVPPEKTRQTNTEQGDSFYPRLLEIAQEIEAKIVLLEVADLEQALRVARRARELGIFDGIVIWRETPETSASATTEEDGFPILGEGNGRSVLCWTGAGSSWLGKSVAAVAETDAKSLFQNSAGRSVTNDDARSDTTTIVPQFDLNLLIDAPPSISCGLNKTPGKDT
jgi:HemK-like putative methylase